MRKHCGLAVENPDGYGLLGLLMDGVFSDIERQDNVARKTPQIFEVGAQNFFHIFYIFCFAGCFFWLQKSTFFQDNQFHE